MIVRAWSLATRLLTQTDFLTPDVTYDPSKYTNTVSETGIEPSCVGIDQKLISVYRKVYTVMVIVFFYFTIRILRFF